MLCSKVPTELKSITCMPILSLIAYIYLRRNVILVNYCVFSLFFSYVQIDKNFTIYTKHGIGFYYKRPEEYTYKV